MNKLIAGLLIAAPISAFADAPTTLLELSNSVDLAEAKLALLAVGSSLLALAIVILGIVKVRSMVRGG